MISNAKRYYYNKILIENRSNPKKIWQTIYILHNSQKLKNQVEITKLQTPCGTMTSPIAIGETLNEFFVNIGPQMTLNIPDVEVDATTTVNLQSHLSRTFFSPVTSPEVERLIDLFYLFYLPFLSSIHEKANCIAILWTVSPHSLGSCLFRGLWARLRSVENKQSL